MYDIFGGPEDQIGKHTDRSVESIVALRISQGAIRSRSWQLARSWKYHMTPTIDSLFDRARPDSWSIAFDPVLFLNICHHSRFDPCKPVIGLIAGQGAE